MNLRGKVIWFYGLSGSGKSTLADELAEHLFNEKQLNPGCFKKITDTTEGCLCKYGQGILRLDGDVVREGLTKDLGFSLEDRFEHIRRVCFVADLLSQHGVCVIASFITPLEAMRIYLREKLGDRLVLVYVDCSLHGCIRRDVKGLYKKALNGVIKNMTGLTQKFDYPNNFYVEEYDVRVNTEYRNIDESLEEILSVLNG